jgi:hypothetical protein
LELVRRAFWTLFLCSEAFKILSVVTCQCFNGSVPFDQWFYPAFQQAPYTFWFHYHGLTWLAGPYSLIWWGLNSPAFFGYFVFNFYILIIDGGFGYWLTKKSKPYAVYWMILSPWFILIDPVDFFSTLLIWLGPFYWPVLGLAILIKLPFGADAWVWRWVFSNPDSLHGVENWGRYLILGTMWAFSVCLYLYRRYSKARSSSASPESSGISSLSPLYQKKMMTHLSSVVYCIPRPDARAIQATFTHGFATAQAGTILGVPTRYYGGYRILSLGDGDSGASDMDGSPSIPSSHYSWLERNSPSSSPTL